MPSPGIIQQVRSHKVCVSFSNIVSVALYTAEEFNDCRMASCGRYGSFPHKALFTASENSLNLRSSINKASNQGTVAT